MSRSLRELYESSPFSSAQAPYVEEQYERFLNDSASVSPEWREFFGQVGGGALPAPRRTAAKTAPGPAPSPRPVGSVAPTATDGEKQSSVSRLIQFYANRGHLIADIDPLGLMQRPMPRVLDPAYAGLTEADMALAFHTGSRTTGVDKQMKLAEILKKRQRDESDFQLKIVVHPTVLERLRTEDEKLITEMEKRYYGKLIFRSDPALHAEEFRIINGANNEELARA